MATDRKTEHSIKTTCSTWYLDEHHQQCTLTIKQPSKDLVFVENLIEKGL